MLKCYSPRELRDLPRVAQQSDQVGGFRPFHLHEDSRKWPKRSSFCILFQLYCYSSHQLKKKKKKVEVWFLKIRMESAGVEIYFFVLSLQVSF